MSHVTNHVDPAVSSSTSPPTIKPSLIECTICHVLKDPSTFYPSEITGRRGARCKDCRNKRDRVDYTTKSKERARIRATARIRYAANPDAKLARMRAFARTPAGVATGLRYNSGLTLDESKLWASILLDPSSRCVCCGISNAILTVLNERGPWPRFLGKRTNRLQLGHIIPSDNSGGFIPMCHACNHHLRARVYNADSAASVLRWVRKQWLDPVWGMSQRKCWWLNKTIDPTTGLGIGGRLHRNPKYAEAQEARFAALRRSA